MSTEKREDQFIMNVRIDLNEPKILKKVTTNKLGTFISNEWKRLIDPYTPQRSSVLIGKTGSTVKIKPFELHYNTPYAGYVYFSEDFNFFKELSPFATDHWDEKAAKAGQLDKLYTEINDGLRAGKL